MVDRGAIIGLDANLGEYVEAYLMLFFPDVEFSLFYQGSRKRWSDARILRALEGEVEGRTNGSRPFCVLVTADKKFHIAARLRPESPVFVLYAPGLNRQEKRREKLDRLEKALSSYYLRHKWNQYVSLKGRLPRGILI